MTEYQKYPGRLDEENPDSFDAGGKFKGVLYEEVEVSPGVRKMLPTALGALLQTLLDRTPELQDGSIPVAVDGGINVTNLTNVDWESTWMEDLDAGGNRIAVFERRTKYDGDTAVISNWTVTGDPYVLAGPQQRPLSRDSEIYGVLQLVLYELQMIISERLNLVRNYTSDSAGHLYNLYDAVGQKSDAQATNDTNPSSLMSYIKRLSAAGTSANSWLQSIHGRLPVIGPRTSANSMPVTPATDAIWSQGTITTAYNKAMAPAGRVNTYNAPDGSAEVTLAAVIAATGIASVALIEIQAQGADVYFRTGNAALGSIATAPAAATDGSSARFIPAGGSILIDVSTLSTGRFILKSSGFVTVSFWS